MMREPSDAQAWVWNSDVNTAGIRCNSCMYATVSCENVPCAKLERRDQTRVIFLPQTPEGFARGAAMTLAGVLEGTAS